MSCLKGPPAPPNDTKTQISSDNPSIQYANGGDTATVSFTGTSVRVFGVFKSSQAKVVFAVDPNDPKGGGTTCQGAGNTPYPIDGLLFISPLLSAGQHTLRITNQGPQNEFTLDHLDVFGDTSTSTASPSQPTPPSSSTSPEVSALPLSPTIISPPGAPGDSTMTAGPTKSGASTSPSPSPSPSPTPTPTSAFDISSGARSYALSSYTTVSTMNGTITTIVIQTTIIEVQDARSSHGSPSRGAIAGAVVGSLLVLVLLIGVALWWWRRRRRTRVRFMYGISNLDFDPAMMTRSSADLPSEVASSGMRESNGTLYSDALPPYKRPLSYSYLASDVKTRPVSERVVAPTTAEEDRLPTYNIMPGGVIHVSHEYQRGANCAAIGGKL